MNLAGPGEENLQRYGASVSLVFEGLELTEGRGVGGTGDPRGRQGGGGPRVRGRHRWPPKFHALLGPVARFARPKPLGALGGAIALWGRIPSGSGPTYMFRTPWMAIWPGVAISLAVFGVNMRSDALRDVLDPRLRGA